MKVVEAQGFSIDRLRLVERPKPEAHRGDVVWWLPEDTPHSRWGSLASTLPNIAYRCRTLGMRRMLDKLLQRDDWDGIVFDGISAGWALPAVLNHYSGRATR